MAIATESKWTGTPNVSPHSSPAGRAIGPELKQQMFQTTNPKFHGLFPPGLAEHGALSHHADVVPHARAHLRGALGQDGF